jgi:hypothetical protein
VGTSFILSRGQDEGQREKSKAPDFPQSQMRSNRLFLSVSFALFVVTLSSRAADPPRNLTRDQIIAQMHPYKGPSEKGVDPSTLNQKILTGYQGWFTAEGDGYGYGFHHWSNGRRFEPGQCKIDLWPDLSDLDPDERYDTPFKHADGSTAQVFSSLNKKTVLRHFQWMKDYGIDGAFIQRFAVEIAGTGGLDRNNIVLDHCREGANRQGRTYAVMYDLSGLRANQMSIVKEDWKLLIDRMQITKDPAYLHHAGHPLVAVWGIGFSDRRQYTLDECADLIRFLKKDPTYGQNTVMLGVPTYWRTLNRDAVADKKLHDILQEADIVSPWTVGRYTTPEQARNYAQKTMTQDLAWCADHKKQLLPVVFPGFSWHNMNPRSKQDQIPRQKGQFLWTQYVEAQKAGATMIYQAMFDEVDEGTAIFKVTNNPPVGASTFLTYEGLPSDYYLKVVGQAGKLIRKEIAPTDELPN